MKHNPKPAKKYTSKPTSIIAKMVEVRGKAGQQDIEREQQRKRDFNLLIDKKYHYSPTIEDFKEELAVRITDTKNWLLWLRETKKIYGNAKFYYLVWGARGTGFDRLELYTAIFNLINQEINNALPVLSIKQKTLAKDEKSYSLRQVCIAYHFMEGITERNGAKLLKLHTRFTSVPKLLQKAITKASDLTHLSENKTTDTKHLTDLKEAKRLISGKKNKQALSHITHTITQFQANYDKHY